MPDLLTIRQRQLLIFIPEHKLDVLGVTETWLQVIDSFTANSVTPNDVFSITQD